MTQEILAADPDWPYSKAKTAVLTAAAEVISETGPRSATLKNIASRAGITEPAIFRHFDGVDGLFGGLFNAFERVYRRIDGAFDGEGQGIDRLRDALSSVVDVVAGCGDFSYILVHGEHVFRAYPELHKKIGEYRLRDRKHLITCVEEGVERGEIRDDVEAESLATAAWGMMHQTILNWIEEGFAFDLRDRCKRRWPMVERMLASPSHARAAARRVVSTKPAAARASAALKTAAVAESTSGKTKSKIAARPKSPATRRK